MTQKRIHAYLLLLFVSILWGIAGPVIKNTLNYYTPLTFLTYRFFVSSLVALGYFTLNPQTLPKTPKQMSHTVLHCFFTIVLGLGLLFFGFLYTDSLTGTLLAATGPIFSIAMGALLLKEHISKHEIIGLSLAFIGSLLTVFTGEGQTTVGIFGAAMIGNGLILVSRIADAYGGVYTKHALKFGLNPSALSHISFFVGFIFFAAVSTYLHNGFIPLMHEIASAPLAAHIGVLYMSLLSGTLGYALMNTALSSVDLGEASIFNYLTVVFGAPLSILWLHDPVTPQFIVGAGMIAIGVIIAEWKRRTKKKVKKKLKLSV